MATAKPKRKAKPKPKRGRPSNTQKAAQKAAIAQRRATVANLALLYVPQQQIATQLGVSTATISTDLSAIKADWLADAKIDIQTALVRELLSLDKLETNLWNQFLNMKTRKVTVTKPDGSEFAFEENIVSMAEKTRTALAILKAKERRAKLLGFDTPELLDVTISDERLVAEVIELRDKLGHEGPKAIEA